MFKFDRSWRKFALSLLLVTLIFMLNACSTKNHAKDKELSVKVDNKVMLTKDYQAKLTATTNTDDTTFKLTESKKTIRSGKFDSEKKADLVFNEPGEYTLTVKNSSKTATKKITVEPYTVTVNKTTTSVDNTQYIIKKIVYEKVKKTKTPTDNAEDNLSDYSQLNAQYYRAKIYYELQNNSDSSIDLSYTEASLIDDSGKDYPFDGTADAYSYDSIDNVLRPKTRRVGYFVMISNTPFSLENLKINVNSYSDTNGDTVGNGGLFELNHDSTNSGATVSSNTTTNTAQDANYDSTGTDADTSSDTYDTDDSDDTDDVTIEVTVEDSTDDSEETDDTSETDTAESTEVDTTEDQDV